MDTSALQRKCINVFLGILGGGATAPSSPGLGHAYVSLKERSQVKTCNTRKLCYRKAYIWVPIHMGAMKIFGTPWLCSRPLFPTFSWAFIPIDPMNVPTKFEVCSFTRSWDNRGYPKKLSVPGYAHAPFSQNFLMGFYSDRLCKYTRQIWSP